MLKGIIFDLDQTLLDRHSTFRRYLESQYSRFPSIQSAVERDDYLEHVIKLDNNGYTPKDLLWRETCSDLRLDLDPRALLADFQKTYGLDPVLFQETTAVLTRLAEHYQLGLITNGSSFGQNAKITHSGIRPLFSTILVSGDEGIKKPHPEIYQRCLARMDLHASDCLFVGDHPIFDVEAPKALGMRALWIANERFPPPRHLDGTLSDISQLDQNYLSQFERSLHAARAAERRR